MTGLGMQVKEARVCLLPLELKEHPDRWTTSTGPPAASFIRERWHTISYRNYHCLLQLCWENQKHFSGCLSAVIILSETFDSQIKVIWDVVDQDVILYQNIEFESCGAFSISACLTTRVDVKRWNMLFNPLLQSIHVPPAFTKHGADARATFIRMTCNVLLTQERRSDLDLTLLHWSSLQLHQFKTLTQ